VVLSSLQRKLMYHPSTAPTLSVAKNRTILHRFPAAADVETESSGGAIIRGWWLRQHQTSAPLRPLVLLFHGNAGHRGGRQGWYELLDSIGCDILAIDYQGYGDSEGVPSQSAVESDAVAAWKLASTELGYRHRDIVVMGISLGGAAAVHVTSLQSQTGQPPAGLVTVATFSSMLEVARSYYPWFPVRAVLQDHYPSSERMRHVSAPLLHFHGDRDRVVKPKFGRRLFAEAPPESSCGVPRRWVTMAGTGHNDILLKSREIVLNELNEFVASVADVPAER